MPFTKHRLGVLFGLFIAGQVLGCQTAAGPEGNEDAIETPAQTPEEVVSPEASASPDHADIAFDDELRSVTLPISLTNQPSNLRPNDYVDVYAYVHRRTGQEAVMVVTRVQVRQVGGRVLDGDNPRNARYGILTIELPRSEAAQMTDIQSRVAGNQFHIVFHDPDSRIITDLKPEQINPELLRMLGLER